MLVFRKNLLNLLNKLSFSHSLKTPNPSLSKAVQIIYAKKCGSNFTQEIQVDWTSI